MKPTNQIKRKHFLFRYEVAWDLKKDCTKIIKEAWNETPNYLDIHNKIQKCKVILLKWKKNSWRKKEGERQRTKFNLLGHIQEAGIGQHIGEDQ